jgi:hypothetical protein
MQIKRIVLLVVALVGLGLVAQLGSSALAQDLKPPPIKLYIGTVTGDPDKFIGISIFDGRATIYICDGQADKGTVSIAEWFIGPVKDSAVDVTAPTGNKVHVDLTDTSATGEFTFADGTIMKFSLTRAHNDTGLYRTEFTLADLTYVGGWLVLDDGGVRTVRGAIRSANDGSLTPATFIEAVTE